MSILHLLKYPVTPDEAGACASWASNETWESLPVEVINKVNASMEWAVGVTEMEIITQVLLELPDTE